MQNYIRRLVCARNSLRFNLCSIHSGLNQVADGSKIQLNLTEDKLVKSKPTPGINSLLKQIQKENRVHPKILKSMLPNITLENVAEDEILLLLNCCGKLVPNETRESRNRMCQQIYEKLTETKNLTLNIYHTYIKVCTENGIVLNHKSFLSSLQKEPNYLTYKALLHNVCESGDISQVIDILNIMKKLQMSVDENDFNSIVLAHAINSGIRGAETVMQTMRAAQISESANTTFSVFKGLAVRNSEDEFFKTLQKYKLNLDKDQFLDLLEKVGLHGNTSFLLKVLQLFGKKCMTKDIILKVDFLCIHLINMGKFEAAMLIYHKLVDPTPGKKYGHFLLREMLLCNAPVETVVASAKHIRDADLNEYVLENTTEIALKLKNFDAALSFFENLSHLRPHFFWPLLVDIGQKQGEPGILNLVKIMVSKNIQIDSETQHTYILPYCNFSDPKLLMKTFQSLGFTLKQLVSPMLVVLLENNKLDLALTTCESYNVATYDDKLLKLLSLIWKNTKRSHIVSGILQKMCEGNQIEVDITGEFLIRSLRECGNSEDFQEYLLLTQIIAKKKLRINSISGDTLTNLVKTKCGNTELIEKIHNSLYDLQDLSMRMDSNIIPHPRNMNIEQLECHLTELKHKSMETRGALRKLIQLYCSMGNFTRVRELRTEFLAAGYTESAGMKSSLMHSCVLEKELELALELYKDLKHNHPNFKLDEFKIIDLATLLVSRKDFETARNLLTDETTNRTVFGGKSLERNCWELLGAFDDAEEQKEMFTFLTKNGYCKPTNVILGPLIRVHLNKNDLTKAVEMYVHVANKYSCTPLQLELLCAAIDSKDHELLQIVLNSTAKVHGKVGSIVGFIAAMAENGLEKPLLKFLLDSNSIPVKELIKRSERWVVEGKIEPLRILERVLRSTPQVNRQPIQLCVMKAYSTRSDCESALAFYEGLLENDQMVCESIQVELYNLLRKCKYDIPKTLNLIRNS